MCIYKYWYFGSNPLTRQHASCMYVVVRPWKLASGHVSQVINSFWVTHSWIIIRTRYVNPIYASWVSQPYLCKLYQYVVFQVCLIIPMLVFINIYKAWFTFNNVWIFTFNNDKFVKYLVLPYFLCKSIEKYSCSSIGLNI